MSKDIELYQLLVETVSMDSEAESQINAIKESEAEEEEKAEK